MHRYAAFLRGINLGRRRATGEQLCAPLRALGLTSVKSFLASGNVAFDVDDDTVEAAALTARIEAALEASLGYGVATFLRSADELGVIVARTPFPPEAHSRSAGKLQVVLLREAPRPEAAATALAHATADDLLALHGAELYWLPAGNMSASALDLPAIMRALGLTTIRTANTLARMHEKFFG